MQRVDSFLILQAEITEVIEKLQGGETVVCV